MPVAFDPGRTAATIDLTNGNLTATKRAGTGTTHANSQVDTPRSSGKPYVEFTVGAGGAGSVGLTPSTFSPTAGDPGGADSFELYPDGVAQWGFVFTQATGVPYGAGDTIGFLWRFSAQAVDIYKNGAFGATVSGLALLAGPRYATAYIHSEGHEITINTGASAFMAGLPAGSSSWDGSQFGPPEAALAATEAPDVAAFAGGVGVAGTLAATEAPDLAAFTGPPGPGGVTATLAAAEAPDTALMAGTAIPAVPSPSLGLPGIGKTPRLRRELSLVAEAGDFVLGTHAKPFVGLFDLVLLEEVGGGKLAVEQWAWRA